MDSLKEMIEEWKKELIEAGEIDPSEELTQQQIQIKYQDFQIKKMKAAMGGLGKSFGITEEKVEKKPKKEKPPKPKSETPKEQTIVGGKVRIEFSQLLKEMQDLHKSLEARSLENTEFFNGLCASNCPELLEIINDRTIKDPEKKAKVIRDIMEKNVKNAKDGYPLPADLTDDFEEYIEHKDEASEELDTIYSQMKEKIELMVSSVTEMEGN